MNMTSYTKFIANNFSWNSSFSNLKSSISNEFIPVKNRPGRGFSLLPSSSSSAVVLETSLTDVLYKVFQMLYMIPKGTLLTFNPSPIKVLQHLSNT